VNDLGTWEYAHEAFEVVGAVTAVVALVFTVIWKCRKRCQGLKRVEDIEMQLQVGGVDSIGGGICI
jgi:flagellar biogenesis protein FliO